MNPKTAITTRAAQRSAATDLANLDASPALAVREEAVRERIDGSVPENTRRAYEFELHCFASWCTRHGFRAMPADVRTIRAYLIELGDSGRSIEDLPHGGDYPSKRSGLAFGTIMRALGAICTSHVRSGHASLWNHGKVIELREHLARTLGVRPRKKKAIDDVLLRRVIDAIVAKDATAGLQGSSIEAIRLRGLRDRALLLLWWHGARRRSEVVVARLEHFRKEPGGVIWLIPKSKTDQGGRGLEVPILPAKDRRYCALRALQTWTKEARISSGHLFRGIDSHGYLLDDPLTGEAAALRVKRHAARAGLDPELFAGHSLRSGWITTAARAGRGLDAIMRTSGHRSEHMVREYIQHESALEDAAGKGLI